MTRAGPHYAAFALVRRTALAGIVAFLLGLGVFLVVGGFRLWPRISGQQLPFSLIWPFARPLLAVALELSFLVSAPLALAVSTSTKTARERTSGLLGLVLASSLLVIGLGGVAFAFSASLDGGSSTPGQLATELVSSARQSCSESKPPAEVSVPLIGFSWSCVAGSAPRLHGKAPLGKQAELDARAIELSDDLRSVSLTDLALAFTTPIFPVRMHAKEATLRGLPPWGRSRRMPFGLRACLFALSAWLAGFGTGWLVGRASWLPAWAGAAVGVALAVDCWLAFTWLERQDPGPLAPWVLPLSVLGALAASATVLLGGRRLWQFRQRAVTHAGDT